MKRALITGITGQDGSYLAELLLNKGYEVHGLVRRSSIENLTAMINVKNITDKVMIHVASLDNHLSVYKLIKNINPDECYHLAASSFVSYSFEDEAAILNANFTSTHYILSSILEIKPTCRFYFAGSSEMFGNAHMSPQNETINFNPRSIYGISKLASYHVVKNYREHHGMFACTGITYNHESTRRGYTFVTRKITSAVARIYLGLDDKLELGNIDAIRDWGYAPEYVEAMWRILNHSEPNDYVIATGVPHTVRDLLIIAFEVVGLDYKNYIRINDDFFRPSESIPLIGDATKIYSDLGWRAEKNFHEIIEEMVRNDLKIYSKGEMSISKRTT